MADEGWWLSLVVSAVGRTASARVQHWLTKGDAASCGLWGFMVFSFVQQWLTRVGNCLLWWLFGFEVLHRHCPAMADDGDVSSWGTWDLERHFPESSNG
jgi:hypothetical protein